MQQGSLPQIGVGYGEVLPAGSQQQQPLQSVHVALDLSGMHMHELVPVVADPLDPVVAVPVVLDPLCVPVVAEPVVLVPVVAEPVVAEPVVLVPVVAEPVVAEPLVLVPVVAEPVVLVPVVAEPVVAEPLVLVPVVAEPVVLVPVVADPVVLVPEVAEPLALVPVFADPDPAVPVLAAPLLIEPLLPWLESDPPSPFEEELSLLQASSPTVAEAPITTTTWNSFSIFMQGLYCTKEAETRRQPCPRRKARVSVEAPFTGHDAPKSPVRGTLTP